MFNVLTGDGETGAALVDDPGVDKVAFTGSTAVGREIGAKCGRALKRVTLELGGKSPNIILPDADLDAAIKGSFQAIYYNSGQACNAGSRLLVSVGSVRRGRRASSPTSRPSAKVGPGLDPDSEFGPVVSAEQFERVTGYIDAGLSGGRRGGRRRHAGERRQRRRLLHQPHPLHRRRRRDEHRPRGDLRPGARRAAVRRPRGGRADAPTTPSTASPPACGPATSQRPTSSPGCSAPATSTSTPGAPATPRRHSAATRRRASAARRAITTSRPTSRRRPSSPSCRRLVRDVVLHEPKRSATRVVASGSNSIP